MSEQILIDKQDLHDYARTLLSYMIERGYFPSSAPNAFDTDVLDSTSEEDSLIWAARLDKIAKLINEYHLKGGTIQVPCDFVERAHFALAAYRANNNGHPI